MKLRISRALCRFPGRRRTKKTGLSGFWAVPFLAFAIVALAPPAHASTSFAYTGTFGTAGGGLNTVTSLGAADYTGGGSLSNWTVSDVGSSSGLAFLYFPGNQGSTTTNGDGVALNGRFGGFSVYDPGNIAGATPSGGSIPNASPGGGNTVAADGAVGYQVSIYTALTSLTAGQTYAVSFWWAAGQQYSFTGLTTEGWQVSLENSSQLTQVAANGTTIQDTTQPGGGLAQGAFQGWVQDTFDFTASGTSQVLSFLSLGTPSGQPPVVFLSDVQVSAVPEPGSMGMLAGGTIFLIASVGIRRKRARARAVPPANSIAQ